MCDTRCFTRHKWYLVIQRFAVTSLRPGNIISTVLGKALYLNKFKRFCFIHHHCFETVVPRIQANKSKRDVNTMTTTDASSSSPTPPSLPQQAPEVLSLSHAMKVADSIRRHLADTSGPGYRHDSFSPAIPPGIVEGLGALTLVGVALLPVRRLVLTSSSVNTHPSFRNFVDLFGSVAHALIATQAGLMAGSLYGGKRYLDEFAKVSPESQVVEVICNDLRTDVMATQLFRPRGLDPQSWDPRAQTLLSAIRVMETCQRRQYQSNDF